MTATLRRPSPDWAPEQAVGPTPTPVERPPTGPAHPATSTVGAGAVLVAVYVALMPFLAGLPRGTGLPLLRPTETLQLVVTGLALVVAARALGRGSSPLLTVRPTEWWLLAVTVFASAVPVLWLAARAEPIGGDEWLATLPMVKYAGLYLLARLSVRNRSEAMVVVVAALASAMVVSAVAVAQSLGVGPVVELLGRYWVSGPSDVADVLAGRRGTTTIGSSIATGAYLTIAATIALALTFSTGRRSWAAVTAVLVVGALASGQMGTVIALAVVALALGRAFGRTGQIVGWGGVAAGLGTVALWPVVAARLADLDAGSGLPESWVIRWVNVTELFVPSLRDGGWVLGVSPDATVAPPDLWRDVVYLESGYLWLLWVGGVPLLAAVLAFLVSAYRDLAPVAHPADGSVPQWSTALARAGRAAVLMLAVLSLLDPHLTLRAGADLFFVLLALAAASTPMALRRPPAHHRWHRLLGSGTTGPAVTGGRIQIAEAAPPGLGTHLGPEPAESGLAVLAVDGGEVRARIELSLVRRRSRLHGVVTAVEAPDAAADADGYGPLAWRGVALVARSLRLGSLDLPDGPPADRGELRMAARLAAADERRRAAAEPPPHRPATGSSDKPTADPFPAVRLDPVARPPAWKRASDLVLSVGLAVATAPLWLLCVLAVRRSSPGPVLFRQVRVGTGGLPFQIYKFRTMYVGNDDRAHREQNRRELAGQAPGSKDGDDPRITGVGRFLRRSSLDELPQLLNVVRGEMSIVGPRPSLLWEVELFEPSRRRRLTVRPGLTGLWQVSGRGDVSMSEMLELDEAYLDGMGPALDLRCLLGTARSVVGGRGAR